MRFGEPLRGTRRKNDRGRHRPGRHDDSSPARGSHHDRNAIVRAPVQEDLAPRVARAAQHYDDLPGFVHADDRRGSFEKVDSGQSQGMRRGPDGEKRIGHHAGQL